MGEMMNYKIVADSGCDLTPELKEQIAVELVPLTMSLGNETYVDDEKLDVKNFMANMNAYKHQPKSSCPSPYDFMEKCDKEKTTFIVTLSSRLSGSYDSANLAKNMLAEQGIDSYVFDSKSASAGQLLIVQKLHELIMGEIGKLEIIKKIEDFIDNMKTVFVLENLDNLIKNGRMSKVTGIIAGALNIKLLLKADDGEIALYSKVRGIQNSIAKLAETIGEMCRDTTNQILAITHCNSKYIDMFQKMVKEKYSFRDIVVAPTKGLTGMYANDGGIIIAF
jgi:DegV family protein with EDD domain